MNHPMFSAEHEMFRESLRKFVRKELVPHAGEWEEAEYFPDWVFKKLGELGYLGAHWPEEYGGGGGDFIFSLILAEELAKSGMAGLGMGVGVHIGMANPPILKFGSEELKRKYITPAARGEKIAALAITEPDAGSDVASIRTSARKEGDEWVINGSKVFITNGARADYVLVVARSDPDSKGRRGISLFVADTDSPGYRVSRKLHKVGMCCSDTAELTFESLRVPAGNLVGTEGDGFKQIMWELQGERIASAASNMARAERAFELALEYSKQRRQFGRPLSGFQVTRHKLADMASMIECCRQFTYNVAWEFSKGNYPVKEISMAKLLCSQVGFKVADMALQIHGGYGYTYEFEIQRYWRDLRLPRIGGGTDEIMKEIIAGRLGLKED